MSDSWSWMTCHSCCKRSASTDFVFFGPALSVAFCIPPTAVWVYMPKALKGLALWLSGASRSMPQLQSSHMFVAA